MKYSLSILVSMSVIAAHAAQMSREDQEQLIKERQDALSFRSVQLSPEEVRRLTKKLFVAIEQNDFEKVQSILVDDVDVEPLINSKGSRGWTPLMAAVRGGNNDIVALLITLGADVHFQDAAGDTPLIRAAYYNKPLVLQTLLNAGADVNVQNKRGVTALMIATRNGQQFNDILKLLLEKNANPNLLDKDGNTALLDAAQLWNVEAVKLLADAGADVNQANEDGITPLIFAADCGEDIKKAKIESNNRLAIINVLIAKGADITKKDNEGATALDYAQACEDKELADALLAAATPRARKAGAWMSPSARRRAEAEAAAKARSSVSPMSLSTSPLGLPTIAEEKSPNQ